MYAYRQARSNVCNAGVLHAAVVEIPRSHSRLTNFRAGAPRTVLVEVSRRFVAIKIWTGVLPWRWCVQDFRAQVTSHAQKLKSLHDNKTQTVPSSRWVLWREPFFVFTSFYSHTYCHYNDVQENGGTIAPSMKGWYCVSFVLLLFVVAVAAHSTNPLQPSFYSPLIEWTYYQSKNRFDAERFVDDRTVASIVSFCGVCPLAGETSPQANLMPVSFLYR